MFTKTITPIVATLEKSGKQLIGITIEYRLFGLLVIRKKMYYPSYCGLTHWEYFDYRI